MSTHYDRTGQTRMSTDPLALLDQLDKAREAATPGEWAQQNGAPNLVYGDPVAGIFVCNTGYDGMGTATDSQPSSDAACIVAEHNAIGYLITALRTAENALQLINRAGCETFTGNSSCIDSGGERIRGARYGAGAWCDPCVAAHAIATITAVLAEDPR